MSPMTLPMFLGLYVAIAPLPHNAKQSYMILKHQPSEQQNHIQDRDTRIAQSQFSSMCDYVRQAFQASGIGITDERTIATLVSGKYIKVSDPDGLYTYLSGHQSPVPVPNDQTLPNGAFWLRLDETAGLAEPNTQNISLKSNKNLVAQQQGSFAIYLKAKGHICRFWIGWYGVKKDDVYQ